MHAPDRRRFERLETEIHCKCRRSARTLYTPARTIDVSAGGALIEIRSPRSAEVGERMAVAFDGGRGIVSQSSRMIGARVVRATPHDGNRQTIAIRFDLPHDEIVPAQSRRAA